MTDYTARLADPEDPLLAVLRVARGWSGPPPTQLLGVPRVITYSYDSAGRLVRSESVEWSKTDVEMALALSAYEADCCPNCQHPLAETTDPKNDYVWDRPVRCFRCEARGHMAKAAEGQDDPDSLLYTLRLKAEAS